jgi:hypothetical protein
MECIEKMHVFLRGKTMDFPLREDIPILHLNCVVVKENKIWVTMSVGTLVSNEGKMLGYIQEKLLVSYVLIWDHDRHVEGSTILLQ